MSYSRDVIERAEAELEKRRMYSEQELEKRREILFSRAPRARQIEQQIGRTAAAAAKAVLAGEDVRTQLEKLRDKNLSLQNELNEIIAGYGLPANYLEPWYKCSACKDRGDIDGKICGCMKSLMRQYAYDKLNSMSPLRLSRFDTFDLSYYSMTPLSNGSPSVYKRMKAVLNYCKRYAENFTLSSPSLLFQGEPGLGKTHLSLAIASELIEKGFGVVYVSAPVLTEKLAKDSFDYSAKSDEAYTNQTLSDCDLLIIDDLGTEFGTRFSIAALYNVINLRLTLLKPMIISTNLSMKELEQTYNKRVTSRVQGSLKRVEFCGTDVRNLKRVRPKSESDS